MASAELNPELCCSLCQKICTDPVALKCGHNFCRICMENKLKEQDEDGIYTCPTCGKWFPERPSLERNRELSDRLMGELAQQMQSGISLCDEDLTTHEAVTHTLMDPTSLENKKCSVHDKLLDCYCTEDDACICHDCSLLGDHKGHNVESLEEACKKKKEKMQKVLQNLVPQKEHVREQISQLKAHMDKEKCKVSFQEEKITSMFEIFTQKIESIKKGLMKYTSEQEDQIVQSVQEQIDMWQDWNQQLSTKMLSIEELCETNDPLRVLQNWKFDEEIGTPRKVYDRELPAFIKFDENRLSQHLNNSITKISKCLPTHHPLQIGSTVIKPSPSKGEPSSDVSKYGSYLPFDRLTLKSKQKHEMKTDQSLGRVLIFCKPVKKQFLIHVYLVPESNPLVAEVITKNEIRCGFRRIEKPSSLGVRTDITYILNASEGVIIENKNLRYLNSVSEEYPYAAIRVPEKCTTVNLHISKERNKAKIWSCTLDEDDLHGPPGTSSTSLSDIADPAYRLEKTHGRVLIFCKKVRNDYLLEIYLVPTSQMKEDIEKKKTRHGFWWIDRPPDINVSMDTEYYLHASGGVVINKTLYCLHSASELYLHGVIRVPLDYRKVKLHISEVDKQDAIWSCEFDNVSFFGRLSPSYYSTEVRETKVTSETTTLYIDGNAYRLNMKSPGLHSCPETGIQFWVKMPMTIKYELEPWSNHMTDTLNNGYQVISPLFKIKIHGYTWVSALYLPHCLSSRDYDSYKSYIKIVHFKDGKMILESPTRIERSHIVLENPTFSFLGVLCEKFMTFIMRPFAFNGIVLIYCKPNRNFHLRLYTMIDFLPNLKKIIDKEIGEEFRWIDKAPQVESVCAGRRYVIQGLSDAKIEPEILHFWFTCPSKIYPYIEIIKDEPSDNFDLCIAEEDSNEIIWKRHLTKDDLTRIPVTSSTDSSASDSGTAKTFLHDNYEQLCKRLGLLDPILLSLRAQKIINDHEEDSIRNQTLGIQQRKALLKMITSKGVEEQFYKILRDEDHCLVQDLEKPIKEN